MKYIDRLENIPFRVYTGVYFLYREGELIYIGVSCNIAVRLWQHRVSSKVWDEVKFIEEPDYKKAIEIEDYMISAFRPPLNLKISKLKHHVSIHGSKPYLKKNYPKGWIR